MAGRRAIATLRPPSRTARLAAAHCFREAMRPEGLELARYLFKMSPLVTVPETVKPSEGITTLKKFPLPAATPSSQR